MMLEHTIGKARKTYKMQVVESLLLDDSPTYKTYIFGRDRGIKRTGLGREKQSVSKTESIEGI